MPESVPVDLPDAEIGVLVGLNSPENVIGLAGVLGWLCGTEATYQWELSPLTISLTRSPDVELVSWTVTTPDGTHTGITDTYALIDAVSASLTELAHLAREQAAR